MTSKTERQASDFTPGTPNAIDGATSSTAYSLSGLTLSAGSYMAIRLDGGGTRAHVRFGTADTVTVDRTTRNTGSPPASVAASNAPHISVADGEGYVHVRIPADSTHLALQCEDASGVVRIMHATGLG
jgi:hypothetical protein